MAIAHLITAAPPARSQGSATVSGMGHLLGYARVSSDQRPHLQVDALEGAGCSVIDRSRPGPAMAGDTWLVLVTRKWLTST
jgi:hypothetical protein